MLTRDCEVAFRDAGIPTKLWFDGGDDLPFLQFVAHLAAARGIKTGRASLKSNGLRGRRIIRAEEDFCLPETSKPPKFMAAGWL